MKNGKICVNETNKEEIDFHRLFREEFKNLKLLELENIIQIFLKNELLPKVRDVFKHSDSSKDANIKATLNDILKERIRDVDFYGNNRAKYNYYDAWRLIEIDNDIKDVFSKDEVELMSKLRNLKNNNCSVFISHFSLCDKVAIELKNFLEFYNIPTFVDDEDADKYGGVNYQKKFKEEIMKRPIFIFIAINCKPTPMILKELEWYDEKKKKKSRLDIHMQNLSEDNFLNLKMNKEVQYLKYFEDGIEKTFNNIIISILNKE